MYTVVRKKVSLFWTVTPMFRGAFYSSSANDNRNERYIGYKCYKIDNCTLTVSPHYLVKLKPHEQRILKVSRHSISLLNRRTSLCVPL